MLWLCQHHLLEPIAIVLISRSPSYPKQEEFVNQCKLFLSEKWQQESGA
jgi:hypothetical protein